MKAVERKREKNYELKLKMRLLLNVNDDFTMKKSYFFSKDLNLTMISSCWTFDDVYKSSSLSNFIL